MFHPNPAQPADAKLGTGLHRMSLAVKGNPFQTRGRKKILKNKNKNKKRKRKRKQDVTHLTKLQDFNCFVYFLVCVDSGEQSMICVSFHIFLFFLAINCRHQSVWLKHLNR